MRTSLDRFLSKERVIASDIEPPYVRELNAKFDRHSNVRVAYGSLEIHLNHFRRYDREALRDLVARAGL